MYTPFEQHNQDFSDKAHAAAQSLVYPRLFNCDRGAMEFERASVSDGGEKAILDGQMAVDRIVSVTVPGLRGPIEHIVQERFRRQKYEIYRDITITEWNYASNLESELYKLKAGVFLYGYFYERTQSFGEVIAVNTSAMLMAISNQTLSYISRINPRTKQSFICLDFDALHDAGIVIWHQNQQEDKQAALQLEMACAWNRQGGLHAH